MFNIQPNSSWLKQIFSRIKLDRDHWVWNGYYAGAGYPYFPLEINGERVNVYIHRLFWMYNNGSVPDGLEIDHICEIKFCVKPDHLQAITHKENMAKAFKRELNKCKRGHNLNDPYNVYFLKNGHRYCRICVLERGKQKRDRIYV